MNIKLYSGFSKRINSTKRPSGNANRSLDGYLREGTNVTKPIIGFKNMGATSPTPYVYAYIEKFSRYYFISDWKYEQGIWYAYMNEDCLATWKTNIGNISAYIERSASASDGSIIDTLYPCDTNFTVQQSNLACAWNGVAPSGGCFVLGIICNASTYQGASMAGGSVTYYVMTQEQMHSLIHYLYSGSFLDDNGFPQQATTLQQMSREMAKAFVNPSQYLVSCTWFPFPVSSFASGNNQDIQVGYYDVGTNHATGKYVDSVLFTSTITGEIPQHPLAQTRGSYLNFAPYSMHTMTVQPFGSITLDNTFLKYGRHIYGQTTIDPITGKAVLRVKVRATSSGTPLDGVMREVTAMIGVPIQLSQVTSDFLGAGTDLVKGGAILANGLSSAMNASSGETGLVPYGSVHPPIGFGSGDMALMLSLPSIGNAVKHLAGAVESTGVNGSYLETSPTLSPVITSVFKNPVAENNSECGRPLCAVRTINTLSGFIKCGEVTVDIPCYDAEKVTIHQHLISGFFWE